MATESITTSAALKAELAAIIEDPRGWNGRRAAGLLIAAESRFAAVDRRANTEIGTALSYAWELWAGNTAAVLAADNAWGFTIQAVQNACNGEAFTAATRTSADGRRRVGHDGVTPADFAGEGDEAMLNVPAAEAATTSAPTFVTPALTAAVATLTEAGVDALTAAVAVESIISMAATSPNAAAAADRAGRESATPEALGIEIALYRRVARQILGTKRGAPGTIALGLAAAAAETDSATPVALGGDVALALVTEPVATSSTQEEVTMNAATEHVLDTVAARSDRLTDLRRVNAPDFIIITQLDLISKAALAALDAIVEPDELSTRSHGERHLETLRRTKGRVALEMAALTREFMWLNSDDSREADEMASARPKAGPDGVIHITEADLFDAA